MTAPTAPAVSEWQRYEQLSDEYGDAFYVVDPPAMAAAVDTLRRAWHGSVGDLRLYYSVKTNPLPALLRYARERGMGAEVGSGLELRMARRAGFADPDIILTGVARGPDVLHDAMASGAMVVVDGDRDVEAVLRYAGRPAAPSARVLLRVRVPTTARPAPRLGMEPEEVAAAARRLGSAPAVDVVGLHCHGVSRTLDSLAEMLATVVTVAEEAFPGGPAVLDLGSCLPSADPGEAERIWSAYAQVTARTLHARGWDATQVVLEPGTPVAAHTTHLVARVLDVRRQPHRTVATVAASILNSSPIRRRVDLPVRLVERPGGGRRTDPDSVSVAGGTLIDGDWLALDLPWSIRPGDFVVVDSVGSYSLGLDTAFIDPQLPVVVREGDEWVTARRRPSDDEACAGFVW